MKIQAVRTTPIALNAGKVLAMKMMMVAVFSFLVCRAELLGELSPFAISFTAALPLQYAWITFIGAVLGYSVLGFSQTNIMYLIMLALVMVIKVCARKTKLRKNPYFIAGTVLVPMLVVNFLGSVFLGFHAVDMAMRLCESVLASGMACFAFFATDVFLKDVGIKTYSKTQLASCAILLMLGIVALMDVQISIFNLGIISGVLLLYFMIYKLGAVGGAVSAIILSIAMNLYSLTYLELAAMIIVAALVAGLFRPMGRLLQVGVFLSMSIFAVFILGIKMSMLYYLLNIVVSSGAFLVIRSRVLDKLAFAETSTANSQNLKDNLENRMSFAACTIEDLQESLKRISKDLQEHTKDDFIKVYRSTVMEVCQSCTLRHHCWNEQYQASVDSFLELTDKLKKTGELHKEDIDETGLNTCCKKNTLTKTLRQQYYKFTEQRREQRRLEQMRNLAVEQLGGVSQMLWEVSDEIAVIQENDNDAAAIVTDVFTEIADKPKSVYCTLNQYDRMEIDIYTTTGVEFSPELLSNTLSDCLRLELEMPSISKVGNKVRISLYEKANFSVEVGTSQRPACKTNGQQESVCGDSCQTYCDNKGNAYLILSDGMGNGESAAVDSTITCSIILKLIKAGFGLNSIIKFVNSTLQAKSGEEALSTIDIVKLDLFTGQAEFYKAGSAMSFVSLDGIVGEVKTNSLPVGILDGVEFDKRKVTLNCGDKVVVLSDGLLSVEEEKLKKVIAQSEQCAPQELANKLCETVKETSKDGAHDDLTAVVLQLKRGV